jgi:hypothetical protein
MKRILFIADHRPDRSLGQRFRCEQYFDALRSNGFECELSYVLNESDDVVFLPTWTFDPQGMGGLQKLLGKTARLAQKEEL